MPPPPSNERDLYPTAAAAAFRADQAANRRPPRVLILCGIPGCGKSTLADFLATKSWTRISQDDLGSRPACERATRRVLLDGRDVVIDRCNFDAAQRAHWVAIGKARKASVGVIVFAVPAKVCVERVRNRTGHPTLQGGEAVKVVGAMEKEFRPPKVGEGIDYCRVVKEGEDAREVAKRLGLY